MPTYTGTVTDRKGKKHAATINYKKGSKPSITVKSGDKEFINMINAGDWLGDIKTSGNKINIKMKERAAKAKGPSGSVAKAARKSRSMDDLKKAAKGEMPKAKSTGAKVVGWGEFVVDVAKEAYNSMKTPKGKKQPMPKADTGYLGSN